MNNPVYRTTTGIKMERKNSLKKVHFELLLTFYFIVLKITKVLFITKILCYKLFVSNYFQKIK